jgi:hypothetical protein
MKQKIAFFQRLNLCKGHRAKQRYLLKKIALVFYKYLANKTHLTFLSSILGLIKIGSGDKVDYDAGILLTLAITRIFYESQPAENSEIGWLFFSGYRVTGV